MEALKIIRGPKCPNHDHVIKQRKSPPPHTRRTEYPSLENQKPVDFVMSSAIDSGGNITLYI